MRITLNGEDHAAGEGETVHTLLSTLGLDARKVAVELNLAIVPRSLHAQTPVGEGDRVEIVRFIGGG